MARILIVEDEAAFASSLRSMLESEGYVADVSGCIDMAKAAFVGYTYDLVVLDRMLPDGDGLELISFCQRKGIAVRFLVLTAMDQAKEKVKGLTLGADDYLAKPFDPAELIARVKASLRRPVPDFKREKTFGALAMDTDENTFTYNGEPVILRRSQALALSALMREPGKIVRRQSMEAFVYGYDRDISANSIETHISRLRKSLSALDDNLTVKTVRGVGYVLTKG